MKIDMSPQAVSRRLNELNQLWKLCTILMRAKAVAARDNPKNKSIDERRKQK